MKNIDFHSHILPNADHGSYNIETSLFQLKHAIRFGFDAVVATPHFYPHRHTVDKFIVRRNRSYDQLAAALNAHDMNIKILKGAEVLIYDGLDRMPGIDQLCIENTNAILLELPFSDFHIDFPNVASRLISNGFEVILAHAERYSPINVEKMIEAGAKLQLNAAALSGLLPNKSCLSWMERGLIVGIGTDIHQKDIKAYKKFRKAQRRYSSQFLTIMDKSSEILNLNI